MQPIEIDPAGQPVGVERHLVAAWSLERINERRNVASEHVIDLERHRRRVRQAVRDGRRWVEGVGVILLQPKGVRHAGFVRFDSNRRAFILQNADRIQDVISRSQVEVAVAVEVAGGDEVGTQLGAYGGGEGKVSAPFIFQESDAVGRLLGNSQVEVAIAVEVAGGTGPGLAREQHARRLGEGAV